MKYDKNYYYSPVWKYLRGLKLLWSGYKCENCGSKEKLQVHHKHYKSFGDEMPWDLMVLCKACHEDIHYVNKPDSEMVIC